MKNATRSFLTEYLGCLFERTRREKGVLKTGFDWVVYQVCQAKGWVPLRLPFFRQAATRGPQSKVEAEFGVDLSFLEEKTKLHVLVLKDERLNNANWTKHGFDSDLRRAVYPDLNGDELQEIKTVEIVLVYNKDEDQNGIELYERFVSAQTPTIGNGIRLTFARWNLTTLVEQVQENLLDARVLPQHLSWQFQYICSQIGDFDYGTEEWDRLLVAHWRKFLADVFSTEVDERTIHLIPVVLIVLDEYRSDKPNSYVGWIDLLEWAMLALWKCYRKLNSKKQKKCRAIISRLWIELYLRELKEYMLGVEKVFSTQYGFTTHRARFPTTVDAVNDAYAAFWHIGRLGLLTLGPLDYVQGNDQGVPDEIKEILTRSGNLLVACLHNNPAALRPLIDLHHVELFLIWLVLAQLGKKNDIYEWLVELKGRLVIRRIKKNCEVPFIESYSRMELVAEHAARGQRPFEYKTSSSYLLLMLIELCYSLQATQRDELIYHYMHDLVMGLADDGSRLVDEEIDLMSWVPPEDWSDRVLDGPVKDGIAIDTGNFDRGNGGGEGYAKYIRELVEEMRQKFPWRIDRSIPMTVYVLACIKNKSPLPPEFWRGIVFPEHADETSTN